MNLIQLEKAETSNKWGFTNYRLHQDFGAFHLKAGEKIPPGAHKHPEIIYVVKGTATFVSSDSGEKLTATDGNVVTIPANQKKEIFNYGKEDVFAFWVNAASL